MKIKFSLVILLILVGGMSGVVFGQTDREQNSQIDRLPSLSQTVNCEVALRYIDDAIEKANSYKSNLILIIKMKNVTSLALARARSNNLRKYLVYRGFTNFEIAVDANTNGAERVELYIRGERLYSLPIKKKDKLDFSVCVVGTDL